jgi:hypothetical protein
MNAADPVAAASVAWRTINRATSFESWKAVAIAVPIGTQHGLPVAGESHLGFAWCPSLRSARTRRAARLVAAVKTIGKVT